MRHGRLVERLKKTCFLKITKEVLVYQSMSRREIMNKPPDQDTLPRFAPQTQDTSIQIILKGGTVANKL
jgi:hypothetical protein